MAFRIPLGARVRLALKAHGAAPDPELRFWQGVFGAKALAGASPDRLHCGFRVYRAHPPGGQRSGGLPPSPGGIALCGLQVEETWRYGPEGPEGWFRLYFYPGFAGRWVRWAPRRAVVRAAYKLLAAWPVGKKSIALRTRWPDVVVFLEPDDALLAGRAPCGPQTAAAVVFTALWLVLTGTEPQEAVRIAHADPLRELATSLRCRHDVFPRLFEASWSLGPLVLPPAYRWMAGPVMAELWRGHRLLDGFRVELASPRSLRQARDRKERCPVSAVRDGRTTSNWWFVGWLEFEWRGWTVSASCRSAYRPDPVPTDSQLATIVRAWPDSKKALLVSRPVLFSPSLPNYKFCAIGLQAPGFSRLEGAEAVFRAAVQAVREGAGAADLREWLHSLDETKVRALVTLHQLAV